MPEISVIVPIYKVENYIHRCIDSILAQTFTDFELILVDDGSPDSCGKICDEYAEKDSRIHVIHKENGGLSDARNAGIDWVFANSDSEWITFIDSDDWVNEKYLELLYKAAMENRTDVSCCKYLECNTQPLIRDINYSFSAFAGEDFCIEQYKFSHTAWGRLYRRYFWNELRFPKGKLHEDAFTIYKILLPSKKIAFIDEPPLYYFYSDNNESITRAQWSPKRMDLIEALENKIRYAKKNSYYRYYKLQIKEYIDTCRWFIGCAQKSDNENVVPYLRKKIRKSLRLGRKEKVFAFCKDNLWVYEMAYPNAMHLYWYWNAIKKRIHLLFSNAL